MTYYYGPQTIDITSYDAFKNAVNGNGYDVDGSYGAQCVDAFMLLNYNLGYSAPYASTGGTGYAYGMWTVDSARTWNASDKYDLIYDKTQIKRGDMIVFAASYYYPTTGHNAFADEDYTNPSSIRVLGQNQLYGASFPTGGKCFNVEYTVLDTLFLGAFRLKQWQQPTPPVKKEAKHKFPWFIYTQKFHDKNNYGII